MISEKFNFKKQFVLGLLFLIAFLVSIEIISKEYHYSNECSFIKSDEYKDLDYSYKRKMCNDYLDLEIFTYPELHMTPNQHFDHYNINNNGFRGPEFNKIKESGTFRIIVVGDDSVFGLSSTSDVTTIPGYLQKKFNQEINYSKKVEVINAGIPSAFSLTETQLIKNHLIDYQPDLFIIYTGANDLNRSYELSKDLQKKGIISQLLEKAEKYFPYYKTLTILPKLITYVENFFQSNLLRHDISKVSKSETQLNNLSDKISIWEERLKDVCNLGEKSGFETVVILQPIIATSNKSLSSYEKEEQKIRSIATPGELNAYDMYAKKLNELNECVFKDDLRSVFDERNESIYMPYHAVYVGDRGNEIISNEIYEIIKPLVK